MHTSAQGPGNSGGRVDPAHFEQLLRQQRREVVTRLREHAQRSRSEGFGDLAGPVHDLEDESVADLLADLNLSEADRELGELRATDAALDRIATGTYGVCTSCQEPIGAARLEAFPTATRCLACQAAWEEQHLTPPTPSL